MKDHIVRAAGVLRRDLQKFLTILGLGIATTTSAFAQPSTQLPKYGGQWTGPYTLSQIGDPWLEIAHGSMIPRNTVGTTPTPWEGDIIFGCRRNSASTITSEYQTFLWQQSRPSNLTTIAVPGTSTTGAHDLFCGGHVWLPSGDLASFGGTNVPQTQPFGHKKVFRFTTTTNPASWTALSALADLQRERWYGTPIMTKLDTVLVAGNQGGPVYSPITVVTREDANPTTLAAWTLRANDNFFSVCVTNSQSDLADYPRLFQLESGRVMFAGSASRSRFLDLDQVLCTTDQRWELGNSMIQDRIDACFAHLILHDGSPNNTFDEVVFAVGGSKHYSGDCCGCSGGLGASTDEILDTVEKMTNPTWSQSWALQTNTMLVDRADANLVILLDGSFLLLGGEGWDATAQSGQECVARMVPERFFPPELFTGPEANTWVPMNEHAVEHRYHSAAVMMPDGRVVLAGGEPNTGALAGGHVVEVFHPPYLYFGARPVITSWPTSWVSGQSQTHTVTVNLRHTNASIKRVALLRPGSVTHSFDFNQRYITLMISQVTMSGSQATFSIHEPPSNSQTPSGWYLLTVLDDNDVPSEGAWVQIQ